MSCTSSSSESLDRDALLNRGSPSSQSSSSSTGEKQYASGPDSILYNNEKIRDIDTNSTKDTLQKKTLLEFIADNQINGSILLFSSLIAIDYALPQYELRNKFFHLQYQYPGTQYYDIGPSDWYFVLTLIVLLTFLRCFMMIWVLGPFGSKVSKITNKKALERYKEQGWSLFYYSASAAYGLYLLYHSEYYANLDYLYIGWPHDHMTASFKTYYLMALASWLQQIFVLNIEARRKDHVQMFSHHIITCCLVIGSYYYYFSRVGHVISLLMDFVDITLSLAKMLKYSGFSVLCDLMFMFFLICWIVLRHGLYNYIVYHAALHSKRLISTHAASFPTGALPKRELTDGTVTVFIVLLVLLQLLMVVWMISILRVFIKVVSGNGADDVRSDSETDHEEK